MRALLGCLLGLAVRAGAPADARERLEAKAHQLTGGPASPSPPPGHWKNLLVTVTATDGCRAQFTWTELVNTPAGEAVLLLFERDGRPLDAREGRIALLASGDVRLGARHVRNALRIEVRPAPF